MDSPFDAYAKTYRDVINRGSAITGESFEYFIGVRVGLLREELGNAPPPRRILDFGCGIGATEEVLRAGFPDAALDGVDESAECLAAARGLGVRGATFHHVTARVLPFATGTFDLVYSNGTFHHVPPPLRAGCFAELARVLRPGGEAFIFENNPLNPVMVREMRRNPFDQGARMIFPWSLRRAMAKAGLRVRRPRYYAFYPKELKAVRFTERYLRGVPLGAQYYVRGTKP